MHKLLIFEDFSASPAFGNFQKPSQPEDQQKDTGFDNDEEYYDESDTTGMIGDDKLLLWFDSYSGSFFTLFKMASHFQNL